MRGILGAMDLMAFVFWGFIGLVFALMAGVFAYVWWTQLGWRPRLFRLRSRAPAVAELRAMRATKVPGNLAAAFKVAASICALLGLVVLGWLATLE